MNTGPHGIPANAKSPALTIDNVTATYGAGKQALPVLHGITLRVCLGHTIGVVGESGSGKSTLAKTIVGRLAPTSGSVAIGNVDVYNAGRLERRVLRRQVQMVPQDPYASLDPRMTVGRSLAEAIEPQRLRISAHRARVSELLEWVSLEPSAASRLPHEFSGGQRQRIAIARALAVEPSVLVADEITSSLDASIQYDILNILLSLQRQLNFACVFITHNLGVAAKMCDEIAVMRYGRVVEQGSVSILGAPGAEYTKLLVASVPDREGRFLD